MRCEDKHIPHWIGAFIVALGLPAAQTATAKSHQDVGKKGEEAGIEYVHGGVGKSAMKKMQKMADRYDLEAIFTNAEGAYLANVEVKLESVDGDRSVTVTTEGPMFMADLPDGDYRLIANVPGRDKARHTFTIRGEDRTELYLQLEE